MYKPTYIAGQTSSVAVTPEEHKSRQLDKMATQFLKKTARTKVKGKPHVTPKKKLS